MIQLPARPVHELAEWRERAFSAGPPTSQDLELADELRTGRQALDIRWLHDGTVHVRSFSWVGIVRFSGFDLRVVPKLVGGDLNVLRMLDFGSGLDLLRRLPAVRELDTDDHLFELICLLLEEEATSLSRQGLMRDYRVVDDDLVVLRGRLRAREQVLSKFGRVDQLACTFDEHDADIPENQFIAAALSAARQATADQSTRGRLARLSAVFSEQCLPPTADPDWYRSRVHYGRRNGHYRSAHDLSDLVLRHLALHDLFGSGSLRVFAFLLDMNVVFERFITRLVKDAFAGTSVLVSDQVSTPLVIVDPLTGKSLRTIRPDLLLETRSGRTTVDQLPVDVKYKLYDGGLASNADIYQAFLYGHAFDGGGGSRSRAALIHPGQTARRELSIRSLTGQDRAEVTVVGLDVPGVLELMALGRTVAATAAVRSALSSLSLTPPRLGVLSS